MANGATSANGIASTIGAATIVNGAASTNGTRGINSATNSAASTSGDNSVISSANADLRTRNRYRTTHSLFKAAAARNLHARNANASHVVRGDDFRKLLSIVDAIEFWAPNKAHAILQKVFVESPIGKRRAIGGHEQIATLEIRRIDRRELDLHGPVRQTGRHAHRR